jgi:hypothetical protein
VHRARAVLEDCRHAVELLQTETERRTFRVLWVAGIALARAVGHVLQKVDAAEDPVLAAAVATAFQSWKAKRAENAIFWEFIEAERNLVLKQYEVNFCEGPVDIVVGGELATLDECLFCPIAEGLFAGEDCRDVLEDAIAWWETQLELIDAASRRESHTE